MGFRERIEKINEEKKSHKVKIIKRIVSPSNRKKSNSKKIKDIDDS